MWGAPTTGRGSRQENMEHATHVSFTSICECDPGLLEPAASVSDMEYIMKSTRPTYIDTPKDFIVWAVGHTIDDARLYTSHEDALCVAKRDNAPLRSHRVYSLGPEFLDPRELCGEIRKIVADYRGNTLWLAGGWRLVRLNPARGGMNQYTCWPVVGDTEKCRLHDGREKAYLVDVTYL